MTASVNGENCEVIKAFDTFMMIELQAGDNEIIVSYEPQYLKLCLIITIISIILFISFSLLNKRYNIGNNKVIVWIGLIGACLILAVVAFLVYLKPLLRFFKIIFI